MQPPQTLSVLDAIEFLVQVLRNNAGVSSTMVRVEVLPRPAPEVPLPSPLHRRVQPESRTAADLMSEKWCSSISVPRDAYGIMRESPQRAPHPGQRIRTRTNGVQPEIPSGRQSATNLHRSASPLLSPQRSVVNGAPLTPPRMHSNMEPPTPQSAVWQSPVRSIVSPPVPSPYDLARRHHLLS